MALAVPVDLEPVRGYLYVAVWDPIIVLGGYPVDSKVDIYRDRLKSVAVGVVDGYVQLLDGLWLGFWLWLGLGLLSGSSGSGVTTGSRCGRSLSVLSGWPLSLHPITASNIRRAQTCFTGTPPHSGTRRPADSG